MTTDKKTTAKFKKYLSEMDDRTRHKVDRALRPRTVVSFRAAQADRAAWHRAATADGKATFTEWICDVLNAAADRALSKAVRARKRKRDR